MHCLCHKETMIIIRKKRHTYKSQPLWISLWKNHGSICILRGLSIQSHKLLQELLYSWISKHSEMIVCASGLPCCSIISALHVNFRLITTVTHLIWLVLLVLTMYLFLIHRLAGYFWLIIFSFDLPFPESVLKSAITFRNVRAVDSLCLWLH